MNGTESVGLPLVAVAGQATFDGCLAVVRVPDEIVRSMLPSGVELPSPDLAGQPCLLAFGEQSEGTAFLGGFPVPWGARYRELMVAIPFAHWAGRSCLFIAGMTCDAWWAVWNGNLYYGFQKRLASMSWDGRQFLSGNDGDQPVFRATCYPSISDPGIQFEWMKSAAALPVLGRRADGTFVRSKFDWDFANAEVEPTRVELALGHGSRALPIESGVTRHDDAYRVRGMRWRLSWPGSD